MAATSASRAKAPAKTKPAAAKKAAAKTTPLQSINSRISKAKADLKANKTGAGQRLDKAITAKAKYYEKKGRASCARK